VGRDFKKALPAIKSPGERLPLTCVDDSIAAACRDVIPENDMADATVQKIYLFKGSKYLQIDGLTGQIESGPAAIGSDWTGLQDAGFDTDIDASVSVNNMLIFFKGKDYAVFDPTTKQRTMSGPISAANANPGSGNGPAFATDLPNDANGDFTQDLDTVITYRNQLYFFKGAYCCRSTLPTANLANCPLSFSNRSWTIASDWKLPVPYSNLGLDASAAFSPVMSDWIFFRGNSWISYQGGMSNTLESTWPGLRALRFDDQLDAVTLVPWALK
jgi:hypothetical protein